MTFYINPKPLSNDILTLYQLKFKIYDDDYETSKVFSIDENLNIVDEDVRNSFNKKLIKYLNDNKYYRYEQIGGKIDIVKYNKGGFFKQHYDKLNYKSNYVT